MSYWIIGIIAAAAVGFIIYFLSQKKKSVEKPEEKGPEAPGPSDTGPSDTGPSDTGPSEEETPSPPSETPTV